MQPTIFYNHKVMTDKLQSAAVGQGAQMIDAEYTRQIEKEGYTPEHDDTHIHGELRKAGNYYRALPCNRQWLTWPWASEDFKPTPDNPVRETVKAGALFKAEMQRLRRLRAKGPEAHVMHLAIEIDQMQDCIDEAAKRIDMLLLADESATPSPLPATLEGGVAIKVFEAAWSMMVEQQNHHAEGWSMAKTWAFDALRDALAPFRTEYGDELDYSKVRPLSYSVGGAAPSTLLTEAIQHLGNATDRAANCASDAGQASELQCGIENALPLLEKLSASPSIVEEGGAGEALRIVQELAEWSRKYPRDTVYSASNKEIDRKLIELEERAKKIAPASPTTPKKGADHA